MAGAAVVVVLVALAAGAVQAVSPGRLDAAGAVAPVAAAGDVGPSPDAAPTLLTGPEDGAPAVADAPGDAPASATGEPTSDVSAGEPSGDPVPDASAEESPTPSPSPEASDSPLACTVTDATTTATLVEARAGLVLELDEPAIPESVVVVPETEAVSVDLAVDGHSLTLTAAEGALPGTVAVRFDTAGQDGACAGSTWTVELVDPSPSCPVLEPFEATQVRGTVREHLVLPPVDPGTASPWSVDGLTAVPAGEAEVIEGSSIRYTAPKRSDDGIVTLEFTYAGRPTATDDVLGDPGADAVASAPACTGALRIRLVDACPMLAPTITVPAAGTGEGVRTERLDLLRDTSGEVVDGVTIVGVDGFGDGELTWSRDGVDWSRGPGRAFMALTVRYLHEGQSCVGQVTAEAVLP